MEYICKSSSVFFFAVDAALTDTEGKSGSKGTSLVSAEFASFYFDHSIIEEFSRFMPFAIVGSVMASSMSFFATYHALNRRADEKTASPKRS